MHSYREIVGKLIQLNALKRISTHRAASEIGLYDGQMPLLETLERDGCLTQKALGCMYRPPVWRYRSNACRNAVLSIKCLRRRICAIIG